VQALDNVAYYVANHDDCWKAAIAEDLGLPEMLVEHALDLMKAQRLIRAGRYLEGSTHVTWVSPELKRRLRNA